MHHVGTFAQLEDECCTWVQGVSDSPDRMDALVWAMTELTLKARWIASSTMIRIPKARSPLREVANQSGFGLLG